MACALHSFQLLKKCFNCLNMVIFQSEFFSSIGLVGTLKSKHLFIRIYRKYKGNSGFFHTLRTIQHRTAEDAKSKLYAFMLHCVIYLETNSKACRLF